MSWKIVVEPEAEFEIAQASDWYNQQRPGLGADFIAAVRSAIRSIRENPFRYQVIWKEYRRAGIARFPYGLIYRVAGPDVVVLSCFHGRRSPSVWRART